MEHLYSTLRFIHISTGSLVMALGLIQILRPKHGALHRTFGRMYYWLMLIVCTSALTTSIYRIVKFGQPGAVFLTSVGIFGLYLVITGYRMGKRKNRPANFTDKLISICAIASALALFATGIWVYTMGITFLLVVCCVFGFIQLMGALVDYRFAFKGKVSDRFGPLSWKFTHLGRMIGSYIAATTAFLVNVNMIDYPLLNWLLPTVIGGFVIAGFTRYYARLHKVGRFAAPTNKPL